MNREKFNKVLDIVVKHNQFGSADVIPAAEHDQFWFNLNTDQCSEDSEDGKILKELGCFVDCDGWAAFA